MYVEQLTVSISCWLISFYVSLSCWFLCTTLCLSVYLCLFACVCQIFWCAACFMNFCDLFTLPGSLSLYV